MSKSGIIGLTDRGPALTRIGILRKGAPKQGNRPGADLKHFRFTSEFPEVAAAFEQAYGKEPTRINVFLLYDEVEDNFSASREYWVAGGLKHRCNGVNMSVWQENGQYYTGSKPCPDRDKPERQRNCKPVGRLSVLIPELERIATVTVLTTSKHDIMSLSESLEGAKWVQRGQLRGIPFILTRREREISTPTDDGKRARRKKSLLVIEPAHHYAVAQLRAMDVTPLLLPPGNNGAEDHDEEEEQLAVDIVTGEIEAPYDEPAPEEAASFDDPDRRKQLITQITVDRQLLSLSVSQLNGNALKEDGVRNWEEASMPYLESLAKKLSERARKEREQA